MDFHVTDYKKFADMISDSTFQLAFKITTTCQVLV